MERARNGNIGFVSEREDDTEIFEMRPDGSGATQLTHNTAVTDLSPAWSPDGRKIAFVSHQPGSANFDIYIMDADGSNAEKLTTSPAQESDPTWSPNGSKLAFVRALPLDEGQILDKIFIMNADGSDQVRLQTGGTVSEYDPDWSPDGRKIAFIRSGGTINSQIYTVNVDGSDLTQLTRDPDYTNASPKWSPDGSKILFSRFFGTSVATSSERTISARPRQPKESVELVDVNWNSTLVFQSDTGEVWAMNAHGSEPLRLTEEQKPYPTTSLSPNGKQIAYTTERIEGGCGGASACASSSPEKSYAQIYVMNSDGSDQIQLMEDSGVSSSPTWSPDGKNIAFALSGSDDDSCTIYAMNVDGSGHRNAVATLDGCYSINSLSWSPDGKKIAFEGSIALNAVDIWVLDVADEQGGTDQPRQLTHTPVGWWNIGPTWSPDSTEITFTHKATEEYDQSVYKINADGSGETRLTHDIPFHGDPADPPIDPTYSPMHSPVWSPGGTKIAFVRGYRFLENPDRYSGDSTLSSLIYVMGSDGSNPTVVKDFSSEQVSNLDWLPGWVDLPLAAPVQAQEERTASGKPPSPTGGCKPVENPVGEIAYQSDEDIWTMNADGSNPSRLTHDQAKEDTPAFSPDGKKIAFVKEVEVEAEGGSLSETPPHLVPKVVVMDANGCDQVVLPLPEGEYAHEPSWSPDGQKIAFWSDPFSPLEKCRLFITNADGSGTPRRLRTPGLSGCILRPEWSPDGDRIAFEGYGQDGWADIYVMDVSREGATSRPRRLTPDNLQQATEPSWSPDGTEIAFVGDQDIYKFDINTLVETRLTTWEGAGSNTSVEGSPTWSPDGERIAFVRDDSDASTSIYVMRSDGSDPTLIRDFPPAERPVPDWRPLP